MERIDFKSIDKFIRVLKSIYAVRKEKIIFQRKGDFWYVSDHFMLIRFEKDISLNVEEDIPFVSFDNSVYKCNRFKKPDLHEIFNLLHGNIMKKSSVENQISFGFSNPLGDTFSKEYAISKMINSGIFVNFEYLNVLQKIVKILKLDDKFNIWFIPEPLEPILLENNDIKVILSRVKSKENLQQGVNHEHSP